MAAAAPARIYSIDEYYAFQQESRVRLEYDAGVVTEMAGTTLEHGFIVHDLSRMTADWAMQIGVDLRPGSGVSFRLAADSVRYPDLFLMSSARAQHLRRERGDYVGCPEMVVEVISESESAWETEKKKNRFFNAGAQVYWMVNANEQRVNVWTAAGCLCYGAGQDVPGDPLLPGLRIPVTSIFA